MLKVSLICLRNIQRVYYYNYWQANAGRLLFADYLKLIGSATTVRVTIFTKMPRAPQNARSYPYSVHTIFSHFTLLLNNPSNTEHISTAKTA